MGRRRISRVPALGLAAAAGVHFAVAPSHLSGDRASAAFFILLGAAQLLAATLLTVRPSRSAALAAATAAALPVAVWAASRTVGIGPAGREPVGLLDSLATALELAALVGLLAIPSPGGARRRITGASAGTLARLGPIGLVALSAGLVALPLDHPSHGTHRSGLAEASSRSGGPPHAHPHRADAPALDRAPVAGRPPPGTRFETGDEPVAVALGELLWVANREDGTVSRLDPATGSPVGPPIPVGAHPAGVALAGGSAWVTNYSDDTLTRIDLRSGRVLGLTPVGRLPVGVAAAYGSVWVANSGEGSLTRVDSRTGRVHTRRIPVGAGPLGVAAGFGTVWVTSTLHRDVVAVDPRTGQPGDPVEVGGGAVGIDAGAGAVWVANASEGTVTRIDPGTHDTTSYEVDEEAGFGRGPIGIAAGGGAVWVANNHDKTLIRLDPETGATNRPLFLAGRTAGYQGLMGVVASRTAVWTTEYESDAVIRTPIEGPS
ncbi:MAG: hypothetical protein ACRDHV_07150 [Actinomycetota bacterium]